MPHRRLFLASSALLLAGTTRADDTVAALLREGGLVVAMRHALAPGTFDPPGFRLGDCGTQRNLNHEGREQARRVGAWFRTRGLVPARVRSSPWCRCLDTARLAFGEAETWDALGSPRASEEAVNAEHRARLLQAMAEATRQRGRFEVWVTHQFVLSALGADGAASGEAQLWRAVAGQPPGMVGRLPPP